MIATTVITTAIAVHSRLVVLEDVEVHQVPVTWVVVPGSL